jgi:cell wall-associated NlpC family hydrolase
VIPADAVIAQAREWVGVPFLHQGRSRFGADCLGFIAAMLAELGSPVGLRLLPLNYSRSPGPKVLEVLTSNCRNIALQPAALLAIEFPLAKFPSHAAIYTGVSIIHCDQLSGGVREVAYGQPWTSRTKSIWALPLVVYQ